MPTTAELQTNFKQLGAMIRARNTMILQRVIPDTVQIFNEVGVVIGLTTLLGVDYRDDSRNVAPNGRIYLEVTEAPAATFNIKLSKVKDSFIAADLVATGTITTALPETAALTASNSSGLTGDLDLTSFTADDSGMYIQLPFVTSRTILRLEQIKIRDEVEFGELSLDYLQDSLDKLDQAISSVDDIASNIDSAIRTFIETEMKRLLESTDLPAGDIIENSLVPAMLANPNYGENFITTNDSGTATSATTNTLTDTGKAFTIDEHVNRFLVITSGPGSNPQMTARIVSNTATELTIEGNWEDIIPSTSGYDIRTPDLIPQTVRENVTTIGVVSANPDNVGRGSLLILALDASTSQKRRSMRIPFNETFRATVVEDSTAGKEEFQIVGGNGSALASQVTVEDEDGRLDFEEIGVEIEILRGTQIDIGTATSGTTTVLTDTGKAFTVNEHVGRRLRLVRGTGAVAESVITANDATTITVSPAFDIAPASGTDYDIIENREEFGAATSATVNSLTDTAQSMPINVHVNRTLKITSGLASGDERTIVSNDADTFIVSADFSDTVVATDTYEVIADWTEGDELHFNLSSDDAGIFATYFRDVFTSTIPIDTSGSETIDEAFAQ